MYEEICILEDVVAGRDNLVNVAVKLEFKPGKITWQEPGCCCVPIKGNVRLYVEVHPLVEGQQD